MAESEAITRDMRINDEDEESSPLMITEKENWDNSSNVGMLLHLRRTRLEIQYAVHQVARFCHSSIEDPLNPICSRSRTGYVFWSGQCPVVWMSKLQYEKVLSATESEYIALSSAMRDLIPLRRLAKTIATSLGTQDLAARMLLTVFQDDNACLSQARSPRYTTRLHFFRKPAKDVILEKIDTTISLAADIFTKGLTPEPINEPRKLLHG